MCCQPWGVSVYTDRLGQNYFRQKSQGVRNLHGQIHKKHYVYTVHVRNTHKTRKRSNRRLVDVFHTRPGVSYEILTTRQGLNRRLVIYFTLVQRNSSVYYSMVLILSLKSVSTPWWFNSPAKDTLVFRHKLVHGKENIHE